MSAGNVVIGGRVLALLALLALGGLLACRGGDRSEAQPDGPVGLTLLDRVPLSTPPAFGAMSPVDRRDGTQVAAQLASDFVTVQRGAAAPDSLALPRLRRWGARRSVPLLTRFLDDSLIAVIHADVEPASAPPRGAYYLSLVDLRHGRVCLDLPLPVTPGMRPHFAWSADTLTAIMLSTGAIGVDVERLRLRLDAAGCPWNYVGRIR